MPDFQFAQVTEYYAPTKILFGLGTSSRVGDEVKALGGTRVLIVTDRMLTEIDVIRPVLDSLDAAAIPYVVFDESLPSAPLRLALKAFSILQSQNCDLVIGIGGGSPLDTAKAVSLIATNGPDLASMVGYHNVPRRGIPKIAMATTNVAGADTGIALVMTLDEETHQTGVILSRYSVPDVVINDPLLTLSMPPSVTADTGVDVLVTGIESLTSTRANPLSDAYAEKIVDWCARYLPVAYAKGSDVEARYHMALGASMAGMVYSSAPLGAVHGLAYTVGARYRLSHGRSMAAILPAVMRYNLPGCPDRFCRIATLMGKRVDGLSQLAGAAVAVEAVEELLDTIRVPHRLRDYGATEEDVPQLATQAFQGGNARFLPVNPRDCTARDVEEILRSAL